MVHSTERNTDELELLEAERECQYEKIVEDLFCNESSGLHVFFQRTEHNAAFIDAIVGFEHQLDCRTVFDAARDEDGFVSGHKVIDKLLSIFNAMAEAAKHEKQEVFEQAHISREEFMAHVQRGFVKIARMYEDSSFSAEDYFLERLSPSHAVSYAGTLLKTKTLPPSSVMDLLPPSSQNFGAVSPHQAGVPRGKLITMSFDQEAAIHAMIREVGMRMTAANFSDEAIAKATMDQVRRVVDVAIRTTSKAIIRRLNPKSLEEIIQRTTIEIIGKLQDLATQHSEGAVSKIIFYFYSPGKENLRAELEKTIHEEVERYYKKIHMSPATIMPGQRVPTKRPSGKPIPPPGVLLTLARPVSTVKTLRPGDLPSGIGTVVQDVRLGMNIPPAAPTGVAFDDEPTIVDNAVKRESAPPAAVQAPAPATPVPPAPQDTAPQQEPRPLEDLYGDDDETQTSQPVAVQAPTPAPAPEEPVRAPSVPPASVRPVANIQPSPMPSTRPIESAPLPPSTQEIPKHPPVISDRPAAPLPRQEAATQQPVSRPPSPLKTPPQSVPAPQPPAKKGFFSRAKKWVVGATLAAAAALGIYGVNQTQHQQPGTDISPSASTANSSDAPKKTVTPPVATAKATASVTAPDVKSAPVPAPQVTSKPDINQPAPEVASVLTTQTFSLGSSEVAKPFTGKASMAEGGVDATPFAQGAKTPSWYQNQQRSADTLLKIYDSHKSQLDKDAVAFIEKNESVLRDLASQKDFTAAGFQGSFEKRHGAVEIFGSNGVYNNLLAFQRIVNLYGGDSGKLVSDGTIIKFTVGSKVMAPEQRFAKAVLFKENPTVKPANPPSGVEINAPAPAPTKNPHGFHLQQKGPQHQGEDPRNYFGFHYQPTGTPVQRIGFTQGVNLEQINAVPDTLTENSAVAADLEKSRLDIEASYKADLERESAARKAALRTELNKKMDRLFAKAKEKQAAELKAKSTYDDAPDIEVSTTEMHPSEMVEIDRRTALLDRGEILVHPVESGGTGSVLLALENGFLKECDNGDKMDRVQQKISRIRMGSLEEYEVLTNGNIYAKVSAHDLEDLRKIIA